MKNVDNYINNNQDEIKIEWETIANEFYYVRGTKENEIVISDNKADK